MTENADELQQAIAEGHEAERLLESDTYKKAIRTTQNRLMIEWAQTLPHDDAQRDRLYYQMRALQDIDETLLMAANAGAQAEGILARITSAMKRGLSRAIS